ncbi:glycosyltransferase [Candidatus Pelagibacter sp.]|nr:glycosyltransferase [Candidatus Pelagibacter sp.]
MNILLSCPSKFSLVSKNLKKLGGIENLNLELAKTLSKENINVTLATDCKKTIIKNKITNIPIDKLKSNSKNYSFDTIISSNDTSLYSYFKKSKKILWLHNKLQIEKSIRKKNFFPIIYHRPHVVFVSNYLSNFTSSFLLFKKRFVIPNFLSNSFIIKKMNFNRKKIFVWSVQRDKGLSELIEIWINKIYQRDKSVKLYIFGVNNKISKSKLTFLRSKNIFFYGRVSKLKLKKTYLNSLAMICLGYDETFCLNALEANSCGLPIITLGKTALKDYSISNYNSIIAKNFNDLENKIFYLLSLSKHKKDILIRNSFNHSKKFRLNIIYKLWVKLIKVI